MIKVRLFYFCVGVLLLCGGNQARAVTAGSCDTLRGSVARAICVDQKLSQLNREMRSLYRKALQVGDRSSLTATQWIWSVERNRTCAKQRGSEFKACIADALNARNLQLKAAIEAGVTSAARPTALTSAPPLPNKQSQNCVSISGTVDRAICIDATLGHWEDRLVQLYQLTLDDPLVRALLVSDQQRWIADRAKSCGPLTSFSMADCVLQRTKRRIEQFVQVINSRKDLQDRPANVEKILTGKIPAPPGLDAETIDRESSRADQSELAIDDARSCIRKLFVTSEKAEIQNAKDLASQISTQCFDDFSKKMTAIELGTLAKPSFDMLVQEQIGLK